MTAAELKSLFARVHEWERALHARRAELKRELGRYEADVAACKRMRADAEAAAVATLSESEVNVELHVCASDVTMDQLGGIGPPAEPDTTPDGQTQCVDDLFRTKKTPAGRA